MLTKIIYLVLGTFMFYFTMGAIEVGGFGFMYRYLFGMAIIALAAFSFLLRPNLERAKHLAKGALIMAAPYMVTVLWSAVIWISEFAELRTMTRGFFFPFYQIIAALVAFSTLYLFGRDGIWYQLIAMCLGNTLIVAQVVARGGVSAFIQELVTLLTTFGEVTGAMMHETEVHDLTFSFGPYAVLLGLYMEPKKLRWWIACAAVCFYLLVGLKRIEIGAIVIAVAMCYALKRMQDNTVKKLGNIFCVATLILSFAYIVAIHEGLFDTLEQMGMDTKGRDMLYRYVARQYSISPTFLGRGLGFSSVAWDLTGLIGPEWRGVHQDAYHNEFVRMYVEVGFFGYIVWFIFYLPVRLSYMWKHGGKRAGILTLAFSIYCMITYATDNTLYYYFINLSTFILMLVELMPDKEAERKANDEDALDEEMLAGGTDEQGDSARRLRFG